MESKKGLLSGVVVLDLSRVLAGPYCGMMLADMGATVIKVELPGRGDDARSNFPIVNGESAYYMNLNRNKQGITLNLKSEKGKEIFRELVKKSDILIENYRPGVMEKLGLGYEDLRKLNPALVYGCVSGFGHYGPYSQRAGYDIIGQAMSGLMSTTGWPGGEPTRTGTARYASRPARRVTGASTSAGPISTVTRSTRPSRQCSSRARGPASVSMVRHRLRVSPFS